jgi:hypothetical protein
MPHNFTLIEERHALCWLLAMPNARQFHFHKTLDVMNRFKCPIIKGRKESNFVFNAPVNSSIAYATPPPPPPALPSDICP